MLKELEMPLVSVIMCTYNEEDEIIKQAVDSICNQTYKNIELLIIDDHSKKPVSEVIDNPITKIYRCEVNKGIGIARNIGFDISKGKYIAIMDADDIAEKSRIEKQVKYMEEHAECDLCLGYMQTIEDGVFVGNLIGKPIPDKKITDIRFLFQNIGMANPTVMFRASYIKNNNIRYDEKYRRNSDYRLWSQIIGKINTKVLDETLVFYRTGAKKNFKKLDINEFEYESFDTQGDYFYDLFNKSYGDSKIFYVFSLDCVFAKKNEVKKLFNRIKEENKIAKRFNKKDLSKELSFQWLRYLIKVRRLNKNYVFNCIFDVESFKCLIPSHFLYVYRCHSFQKKHEKIVRRNSVGLWDEYLKTNSYEKNKN